MAVLDARATQDVGYHITASTIAGSAALLLALYILVQAALIVYTVWFSPLSKYPGPKLWIAFPILKAICLTKGQVDFTLRDLHERHGDIVRVGPTELSFTTKEAWKDIYGHRPVEMRKYMFPGVRDDPKLNIINGGPKDHARFRRAMLPAFSINALAGQEAIMQSYVNLLLQRFQEIARRGQAVDIVSWYNFTTFDMIGDLAFGEEFNGLKAGKSNDWIKTVGALTRQFPPIVVALEIPIVAPLLATVLRYFLLRARKVHDRKTLALTTKRMNNEGMRERGDFIDMIMRNKGTETGLTLPELSANADVLIIAGSETTATLLSGVTYYLLKNPDKMKRVKEEVRSQFGSVDDIGFKEASAQLPYMLACLNEALRLFPPVPTALCRLTPPGGPSQISGHMIPAKTQVGVHHLASYHSSKNFHLAREFHPERWLPEAQKDPSNPFYNDNRDIHRPFSIGPRDCIGKNLAYHEMRLIMAKVLWSFDLELMPESGDWAENQKTSLLWEKPAMMVKIYERKR